MACVENLGLNWAALYRITTVGALNMVGQNVELVGRIIKFMKLKELKAQSQFIVLHTCNHYVAKQ